MLSSSVTPFVKQFTDGLPLEIKCQILGVVAYDYFAVIPRLKVDESLFPEPHFQRFLMLVLSRSIRIEIALDDDDVWSLNEMRSDDPDVLTLLQFGCRKVSTNGGGGWIDIDWIEYANKLEFITLLNFEITSLYLLAEIMDLSQLHRLTTIKLDMKDGIDTQGGGYKKTIENLKSWFSCGRKNFNK
ncbi:unnamed protein product [Ambrosiozyma monospora]|uniref:Unnamed protein product n=1 Tax=Ambrosiozyma monospora TaxID=43982 RepID=A0ACB5U944_AMBMO|nr:unnamed protein product [Ambrosiozyma monospora]